MVDKCQEENLPYALDRDLPIRFWIDWEKIYGYMVMAKIIMKHRWFEFIALLAHSVSNRLHIQIALQTGAGVQALVLLALG